MIKNMYRNIKQYIDQVVNYVFDLLIPIRMMMYFTGGIIYTLYEFSLALVFRIPAILISMIEGVDPKFYGRCLTPDSIIVTKDGIKEIKDINIGDMVLTNEGVFKPVKNIFTREYNGTIYKPKMSHINFTTASFTEDHNIFTKDGKKKSQEITTSDYLMIPKIKSENNITKLDLRKYIDDDIKYVEKDGRLYIPNGNNGNMYGVGVPAEVELNDDFLWFLGLFVAEGSAQKDKGCIQISFNSKENDLIEKCDNILSELGFHFTPRFVRESTLQLVSTNVLLNNILSNLVGRGAKNKHFPDFVFDLNIEQLKPLLKGYWDGDGYLSIDKRTEKHNKKIQFDTVSITLAFETFMLLAKIGIIPNIRKQVRKPIKIKDTKYEEKMDCDKNTGYIPEVTIYSVSYLGDEEKFLTENRVIHTNCSFDDDYIYFKVKDIEQEQYSGIVYNLEIEDIHSYSVPYAIFNCSNSRNFAIMEFLYKWVSLILFPIRLIMHIPAKIFFGLLENLYLIPCPILYAEQFMDPVTHRNASSCEYDSILDNVHIIPTPSEVITPIKNVCYYTTNPIEFVKEFCAHLFYLS